MNDNALVSRHLLPFDDLGSFNSGVPSLDEWLRRSALHAEAMRSGRTWVWSRSGSVVTYFTLAVLIARVAPHHELHGQGLGGTLLADASRRIVDATDIVAARFVVVDAISDEAASFYTHYGYRPLPGTRRLIRKISDLRPD